MSAGVTVLIQLATGDRFRAAEISAPAGARFLPIDITAPANEKFEKAIGKHQAELGGVPFELSRGLFDHLSLRQA